MHVYQMRSSVSSVVSASQERINVCMNALKEVSKVWLVARMVHILFDSILGNKVLEERLQRAAGKRHQKPKTGPGPPASRAQQVPQPTTGKRKLDNVEFGYSTGPPAPQLSYERSRPQTPSLTPSRELGLQSAGPENMSSPLIKGSEHHFIPPGTSRGGTRPASPFAGNFSIPATPPDLFLVTRKSPPISQSLWENFQPDQLFPDGTNVLGPTTSPGDDPVDPQLQFSQPMQQSSGMVSHEALSTTASGAPSNMAIPQVNVEMSHPSWPIEGLMGSGVEHQQDDSWSNSSRSVPMVPTTLNVEDW